MPQMAEKLQKGEFTFRSTSGRLLAVKYYDKREVYMLTTAHCNKAVPTGKVDCATGRQILKPECIVEYKKYMGGVDKTDTLLSAVECIRRTAKWYKNVFFHILDLALLKSRVLFEKRIYTISKISDGFNSRNTGKIPSPSQVCFQGKKYGRLSSPPYRKTSSTKSPSTGKGKCRQGCSVCAKKIL